MRVVFIHWSNILRPDYSTLICFHIFLNESKFVVLGNRKCFKGKIRRCTNLMVPHLMSSFNSSFNGWAIGNVLKAKLLIRRCTNLMVPLGSSNFDGYGSTCV